MNKCMDKKLFKYYLELKCPEAGKWNTSVPCIHTELVTRNFISQFFSLKKGMQVCNVGIGTGDWDDYLGYWLDGNGALTSIDIDTEICEIFEYRQKREGHPNPATVISKSIFDKGLPKGKFDLLTLIGSAVNEVGDFEKCLDSCISLLKPNGYLMFMAHSKLSPMGLLNAYVEKMNYQIEKYSTFEEYEAFPFYICKIKKR